MNIKTITCHDVYNYGASLQAYALQEYLTKLGHNVEIIDYKPEYLQRTYNFWYIPLNAKYYKLTQKSKLMHLFFAVMRLKKTYATRGRIKPFKLFKKKYLHLTTTYYNYKQLYSTPPKASVYIAGSDQIWNTKLPNGKDPAFYLGFGDSKVKKISYAASFGITEIEPSESIKNYLQNFDAISVREKSGIKVLSQLGLHGESVMDPVFLLEKEQWTNLLSPLPKEIKSDYILIYDIFQDNAALKKTALLLSKKFNLLIVSINDKKKLSYADINISNGGPLEFLSLIYSAKYVISCSFHATAFALIFNKPFFVFYQKNNISRMADLLKEVRLEFCLNPQILDINFNWQEVNHHIELLKEKSKSFLREHINDTH